MAKKDRKSAADACAHVVELDRFRAIVEFNEQRSMLVCCGDEDRSTQGSRRRALARAIRAQSDVVVDLSELSFADGSVMLDLAVLARRLRVRGRALHINRPQPQVQTMIEVAGLHRLPGVRIDGLAPAFA